VSTANGAPRERTAHAAEHRDERATWIVPAVRAVAALAVGLTITFTAEHAAPLGLIGLAIVAIVQGAAVLAGRTRASSDATTRRLLAASAVGSLLAGVAALVALGGGAAALIWIGGAFGLVVGGLELAAGLRDRRFSRAAADWLVSGAVTMLLGAALLIVPPDLADAYRGQRGNTGVLTGALMAVGLVGAWAVILGVLHAIGAVSLRGRRAADAGSAS
jgi:uncharacterized membrane protein HdeD (DUF308 family)